MVFKIDGTDLNQFIVVGDYEVNFVRKYNAWVDGNLVEHRDYINKKAEGKCSLLFVNNDDYAMFVNLMESARKNGGYYECEMSVNNSLEPHKGNFFLDFAPVRIDDASSSEKMAQFELEIVER